LTDWRERFAAFVARKEREAAHAALPPYVTKAIGATHGLEAIGSPWSRGLFDGDFYVSLPSDPRRPACNLVFVQSSEGNTVARNPSLLGGGETDKHLIYEGLSRVTADAVLAGAETIRGGQLVFSVWHPELVALRQSFRKPRHPTQIVATLHGLDLESHLIFNVPDLPVVVLTVESGGGLMEEALSSRPWITPVVMSRAEHLAAAFLELRTLGIGRISAVGGRHVATKLIDAGLIQDVYLTTAPKPGGEPNTPMHTKPLTGSMIVLKGGTGPESGVIFEHRVIAPTLSKTRTVFESAGDLRHTL
jgi:riboflavin biosynthesis pyrimidine reductase